MKTNLLFSTKDAVMQYQEGYLPGFDCALATLRNTLAFYRHRFSNAMVLGLSGSYCFLYLDSIASNVPYFLLTGISHNSIESLTTSLNSYLYKDKQLLNSNLGMFFDKFFERGLPVHIAVDRSRLQSYIHKRAIETIEEILDIGYHYITVVQRDKDEGSYIIFETDDSRPYRISEAELLDVWYYDCGPKKRIFVNDMACDGKWYAFLAPHNIDNILPQLIRFSLLKAVNNFFYPYSNDSGIAGLERFRSKAPEWCERDPRELCTTILLNKTMEYNLTGGGFGRKLYGRYLSEVSQYLEDGRLAEIARMFDTTAQQWKGFVEALFGVVTFDFDKQIFNVNRLALRMIVKQNITKLIDAERRQMDALKDWTTGVGLYGETNSNR